MSRMPALFIGHGSPMNTGMVHMVFTSRRGVLPGVQAVLDFLAEALSPKTSGWEAAF